MLDVDHIYRLPDAVLVLQHSTGPAHPSQPDIASLRERMKAAVAVEDYQEANRLKLQIQNLQ